MNEEFPTLRDFLNHVFQIPEGTEITSWAVNGEDCTKALDATKPNQTSETRE